MFCDIYIMWYIILSYVIYCDNVINVCKYMYIIHVYVQDILICIDTDTY